LLLTLLLWSLLAGACLPIGAAVLRFTESRKAVLTFDRDEDRFLAQLWLGILVLSSTLLAISQFAALQPLGPVLAGALALVSLAVHRSGIVPSRATVRSFAVVAAVCSLATSGVVMLHDTGLYHYGLVRWLAEYGTVKGLGLVAYRFGFSSSWFATIASLEAAAWGGHAAAVGNGFLFTLMLFHWIVAIQRTRGTGSRRGDWFILGASPIAFAFILLQRQHVSASPNLVVAGGTIFLGWLLLTTRSAAPVIAAGALVAVKLTAAPLLLVAVIARRCIPGAIFACLLAAPLVVSNYRTTGCPLFPASIGCSGTNESLSIARASEVERETRDWARYLEILPSGTRWAEIDWIPDWLVSPTNLAFTSIAAVSLVTILRRKAWNAAAAAGAFGLLWILLTVPDFRLGFGLVALLAGLAVSSAAKPPRLPGWLPKVACALVLLDAAAHEAGYLFMLDEQRARPTWRRVLLPAEIRRPEVARASKNNFTYWMPTSPGGVCWGAALPCMIEAPAPSMQLRDPAKGAASGWRR
jgi:hypothetical protein